MTQQLSLLFLLLKVLLSVLPLNDVSIARQERLEHLMMEHKRMGNNTRRLATACQKNHCKQKPSVNETKTKRPFRDRWSCYTADLIRQAKVYDREIKQVCRRMVSHRAIC